MNKPLEYDIVIAGGGLVGASMACALGKEDVKIAIIEPVTPTMTAQPSYDDRGLALSYSSIKILQGLGLWQSVKQNTTPINRVHVSNKNHFGFVDLDAAMMQLPSLGYVVIARDLGQALFEKIEQTRNIDLFCPAHVDDIKVLNDHVLVTTKTNDNIKTIKSNLVIVADGTESALRGLLGVKSETRDYQQTAIVTNITPEKPRNNTAYERFTESGPLALLPLSDQRYAMVFTVASEHAKQYLDMNDNVFLDALHARFGNRLGKFKRAGKRKAYPIKRVLATEQVMDRVAIMGNAAHTVHPNGAQGFNLGLRDVAGLIEILTPVLRAGDDPGNRLLLEKYLQLRAHDQDKVTCFTDGLASLFCSELPHKIIIRNTGMMLTNLLPPLKKAFIRRAMGLHGKQPALVRGSVI